MSDHPPVDPDRVTMSAPNPPSAPSQAPASDSVVLPADEAAKAGVDSAHLAVALAHLRDGRARVGRLHRDIDESALAQAMMRRCNITNDIANLVAAAAMAEFHAEVDARREIIAHWLEAGLSQRTIARRLHDEHELATVSAQREVNQVLDARYEDAADARRAWAEQLAASSAALEQILAEPGLDAALRVRAIGVLERVVAGQMAHAALPSLAHTGRIEWARGMGRLGGMAGAILAIPLSVGMSESIGDVIVGLMGLMVPLAFVGLAAGRGLGWACEGFRGQR